MEVLDFLNVGHIALGVIIFIDVGAELRIIFLCT